ncbi:MAG: AMP-binding protein [Anaerolineae bacterium]|nr:AMP-binding protein [Anaerolineae bacterium]
MLKPWLTHYDSGVPESLHYPVSPLDHLLIHTAHKTPKQTAVIFANADGRSLAAAKYSYKELTTAVYQFAAGLQQLGIQKGDRVAVMLPNCPQFIIALNAIWRLGAIAVCAESRYGTRNLEEIVLDSGSETIISTEKVAQRLEKSWDKLPLDRVIVTDVEDYLPWQTKRVNLSTAPLTQLLHPLTNNVTTIPFNKVFFKEIAKLKLIEVSFMDTAVILYAQVRPYKLTGVQLTHRNLVSNATAVNAWCQTGNTQDRRLAVVPFSHAFGLTVALNTGIFAGDTLVILHNLLRPEQITQAIKQYQINILPATPAMLTHLAAQSQTDAKPFSNLQKIISSGPLPSETFAQLSTLPNIHITETFGRPETSAVVTMNPLHSRKSHTLGIPLPDTSIMIADAELGTNELPPGEIGEIIAKGPQIMQSYWRQPGTAAEYVRIGPDGQHGWYFTGHFGYMDEDGFLYLTEQRKEN